MSDDHTIPDDVRRFVLTSVPSVPYLEAALLFQREPDLARSTEDTARALYIAPRAAGELLAQLCDSGVLRDEGGRFLYAPAADLEEALNRLARCYASDLIGVTKLIHDMTQQHAQRFADAFKWRRKT